MKNNSLSNLIFLIFNYIYSHQLDFETFKIFYSVLSVRKRLWSIKQYDLKTRLIRLLYEQIEFRVVVPFFIFKTHASKAHKINRNSIKLFLDILVKRTLDPQIVYLHYKYISYSKIIGAWYSWRLLQLWLVPFGLWTVYEIPVIPFSDYTFL